MLILLTVVAMLLGASAQEVSPPAEVTLVVERASAGGHVYTCNGKRLDPKRVLTGVHPMLRANDPGKTRMFILFGGDVSLDTIFEVASLIEGTVGLKDVKYFVFSRKTGVMQEIKPSWDRWKLSFDGKLERKPL